jgi:hypothetical protein
VFSVRVAPRRLFGLAPTGGYRAIAVTSDAVGSYPTVSPLPFLLVFQPGLRAVYFLLPCPSPFSAQALPGSLPYGARTFLGHLAVFATIAFNQWRKDNQVGDMELDVKLLRNLHLSG